MPHYTLFRRWNLHVIEDSNCCSGIWYDELEDQKRITSLDVFLFMSNLMSLSWGILQNVNTFHVSFMSYILHPIPGAGLFEIGVYANETLITSTVVEIVLNWRTLHKNTVPIWWIRTANFIFDIYDRIIIIVAIMCLHFLMSSKREWRQNDGTVNLHQAIKLIFRAETRLVFRY